MSGFWRLKGGGNLGSTGLLFWGSEAYRVLVGGFGFHRGVCIRPDADALIPLH